MNLIFNGQFANGIECIALPKDKVLAQNLSAAVAKVTGSRLRGDKGYIPQESSARGKLVKEADIAVKLRNAILHYLQQDKEITTRCDGYGSVNLDLKEAIKLIKGSDVSLEIHTNASNNKTANGIECIALPKDKVLAQKLSAAVSKITGSRLRGDKGYITQEDSARGKLGYVSNGGLS